MEKTRNLALLTLGLVVLSLIANITANPLILVGFVPILGLILTIKFRKDVKDYDYFIGAILAGLASLYQAIYLKDPLWIFIFASTYIGYVGAAGVFRSYFNSTKLIEKKPVKSIIIGIIAGLILAFINLGLFKMGLNGKSLEYNFTLEKFLAALMPGIYEEVGLRYLFYGLAIYILKGEPVDKRQNIILYILMIMPHLLSHKGVGFMDAILLFVLFGLPMSMAQRKVDVTTAIIIHTVVDFIRFAAGLM